MKFLNDKKKKETRLYRLNKNYHKTHWEFSTSANLDIANCSTFFSFLFSFFFFFIIQVMP